MKIIELQNLVNKTPTTKELLSYKKEQNFGKQFKISVYRNHAFEFVLNSIWAYLDYAKINADFALSDYDDSLCFDTLDLNADLVVLWVDLSRYKQIDVKAFLKERVEYLRSIYKGRILLVPFFAEFDLDDFQVAVFSTKELEEELKEEFKQERLEAFSGTKVSPKALLCVCKDLGLKFIPALLLPNIKAVVFDCDNTLYSGVVGEDGIEGVQLSGGHKALQEFAVELKKRGFFLAIASKNDEADVVNLFEKRDDFALKLGNVSKACVSWQDKALSISQIAQFLNIGIGDILFVDDNLGEVANALNAHPALNVILASNDAKETLNALKNYPRMLKLTHTKEDDIRQNDVKANEDRMRLASTLSKEDYLKSLQVKLTYGLNVAADTQRVFELANKTNQFITTYKRYSLQEVEELMQNELIVTTKLQDKLSDSGIVSVCVFENESGFVRLAECFVSCRALGRGLDEMLVCYPILLALRHFQQTKLQAEFVKGERNTPAENYFNENLADFLQQPNEFKRQIDTSLFEVEIKG